MVQSGIRNDISLTPLERELLIYVEKLTEASEQSAEQFKALEKKWSDKRNKRQTALEETIGLLMDSHLKLGGALSTVAISFGAKTGDLPEEFFDSMELIEQSLKVFAPEAMSKTTLLRPGQPDR